MLYLNRRSSLFNLLIVAIALAPLQANAAETKDTPKTATTIQAAPVNPKAGAVRMPSNDIVGPARVRILLTLTPFETVNMRAPNGQTIAKDVPLQPVQHILRARLEQTNHFYFGQWHVESVPLRWQKATSQYAVQLNVHKRMGPGNEVEEKVGSVRVDGTLEEVGPRLYTLIGTSNREIANPIGQKILTMAAGTAAPKASDPPTAKPLIGNSGQVSEF